MTRAATFLSALSLVLTSAAAVSPITEYFYVGPYVTNSVKGLVMGDTGDYSTMRYEDKLFLKEADLERFYFGGFNIDSNSYRHIAGRETVDAKIDSWFNERSSKLFIDPKVELSTTIRYPTGTIWHVTSASNVTVQVTNVVTVSQTMTNGTEDVHVSSYSFASNVAWEVETNVVSVARTNLTTHLKYFVFAGNPTTVFDSTASQNPLLYYGSYGLPYSKHVMTNHYALVRACRRTHPKTDVVRIANAGNTMMNLVITREYLLTGDDKGVPTVTNETIEAKSPVYSVRIVAVEDIKEGTRYDPGLGRAVPYIDTNSLYKSVYKALPTITDFRFVTGVPKVAEQDAGKNLIHALHPYLYVKVYHQKTTTVGYSTNTNAAKWATERAETNETFHAVIPLGNAARLNTQTEMVEYHVRVTGLNSKIENAISGWGMDVIDETTDPVELIPRKPGEVIWSTDEDLNVRTWYRRWRFERTELMGVTEMQLVYVLDLKPRTTLSTWNEYNN